MSSSSNDNPLWVLLPGKRRWGDLSKRERNHRVLFWIGIATALLAIVFQLTLRFDVANLVLLAGMWIGFPLIHLGWWWRSGDAKHCSKCDQIVPPVEPVPDRCPECGNRWLARNGFTRGSRIPRPALGLVGIAICVLTVVWFIMSLPGLPWKNEYLPLNVVLSNMANSRFVDDDEFAVILNRSSTPADQTRLIEAMLDCLRSGGNLGQAGDTWLYGAIRGPASTSEFLARYYQEWLRLDIEDGRLEYEFKLMHQSQFRYIPNEDVYVWLESIAVDGHEIQDAELPRLLVGGYVDSFEEERQFAFGSPRYLDGLESGRHRLTATITFIACPAGIPTWEIVNGRLKKLPGATWFNRVEVDHHFTIRP